MAELKFPTLEEIGRQGAKWALDVFEYKGLTIRQWVDKITTGEYQPVKHGRWIRRRNGHYYCNNCGCEERFIYQRNYCPKCGAVMDEEDGLEKQEPTQEAKTEGEE